MYKEIGILIKVEQYLKLDKKNNNIINNNIIILTIHNQMKDLFLILGIFQHLMKNEKFYINYMNY